MTDEMVKSLNFGGGDMDLQDSELKKKSREERLAEIMEKSKAYKLHYQEIKQATEAETRNLDEEWGDVAQLLQFKTGDKVERGKKKDEPD